MVQSVGFPAQVSAEDQRVGHSGLLEQGDQLFALDLELRIAAGVLHAQHGVAGGQATGNQQRRLQATLDFADLRACQGGQTLFDQCLELLLGTGLHQLLGALAGVHGIQHQCGDNAQDNGTGQGGDGKLDRPELHEGLQAQESTSALPYRPVPGKA
ncbi:hypothetical protein D3C77_185250 [compost metagenome]